MLVCLKTHLYNKSRLSIFQINMKIYLFMIPLQLEEIYMNKSFIQHMYCKFIQYQNSIPDATKQHILKMKFLKIEINM